MMKEWVGKDVFLWQKCEKKAIPVAMGRCEKDFLKRG